MSSIVLGLILFVGASGCVYHHRRTWNNQRTQTLEIDERSFQQKQFHRRTAASLIMAAVGLAICFNPLISSDYRDSTFWVYWSLLTLAVMCFGGLAIIDMLSLRARMVHIMRSELRHQVALRERMLQEAKLKKGDR